MNIKELMIGDLFRVNRYGLCIKKDTIVQIRGIDADNKFEEKGLVGCANCRPLDKQQYDGGIWVDYLSPIPITSEILEKNGFEDVSDHTLKGCETYELSFGRDNDQKIIYKLGDYFAYESYDDRWYRQFETQICHKWCVHHLQHALRLCGIEKEITI